MGREFYFSDALSFGKISTLSPTATSNISARQARACQETDGAVLMKRMLIEDRRVWGLTDHVAARHVAHSAYVETLRATYLHVGDTPDGEWGLYCPRTRRSGTGRWITLFTVRYDLSDKPFESAKEELAHDGQGFASCSFVRWMSVQHPATLDAWHRTVFDLYEKL